MSWPNPKPQNGRPTRGLSTRLGFRPYNKLGLNVRADKNSCPIQPVGQKPEPVQPSRTRQVNPAQPVGRGTYVQPCPTLGLDARARVQPNPTVTLTENIDLEKKRKKSIVQKGLGVWEFANPTLIKLDLPSLSKLVKRWSWHRTLTDRIRLYIDRKEPKPFWSCLLLLRESYRLGIMKASLEDLIRSTKTGWQMLISDRLE
jgi:hypothetical protein